MTGFASVEQDVDGTAFQLDARSVNGRSLDVRVRVPAGLERVEAALRALATKAFRRGSITLSLTVRRPERASRYTVNHDQLSAYLDAIAELAASGAVAAPRADGLLALRGVIETAEDGDGASVEGAVTGAAADLIAELAADRTAEGARIAPLIMAQLDTIDRLRAAIDAHPERQVGTIKARLASTIAALLEGDTVPEARLHQEAALLATRADVREELDRLAAHVAASRALLAEGGPVGRKLDFLAQEFNREVNTICAKAPHHTITQLGLELKAVVEQMREQVQNLE